MSIEQASTTDISRGHLHQLTLANLLIPSPIDLIPSTATDFEMRVGVNKPPATSPVICFTPNNSLSTSLVHPIHSFLAHKRPHLVIQDAQ